MKFTDLILPAKTMYKVDKLTTVAQSDGDLLVLVDYSTEYGSDTIQSIERDTIDELLIRKCFATNRMNGTLNIDKYDVTRLTGN